MAILAIADAPVNSVFYIRQNADGTWPNRLSSRTDLVFIWLRIVSGSADPASVTSPAVNGAYNTGTGNDFTVGV